ncbi:hypothetical protein [Nocardia sp. NPDC051981]|uniref:hypothetical protein n=1 Tax=Nocardia sp. NPDC051981 TaxID=3155417 RepID=UPI003431DCDB
MSAKTCGSSVKGAYVVSLCHSGSVDLVGGGCGGVCRDGAGSRRAADRLVRSAHRNIPEFDGDAAGDGDERLDGVTVPLGNTYNTASTGDHDGNAVVLGLN